VFPASQGWPRRQGSTISAPSIATAQSVPEVALYPNTVVRQTARAKIWRKREQPYKRKKRRVSGFRLYPAPDKPRAAATGTLRGDIGHSQNDANRTPAQLANSNRPAPELAPD